ncbi:AAA-like domain protein [Stieleria maiorica]|uniref:AAA-like domain protein n=1 Tax=Stieleria maiorica TaxID=2795974 RepID=A0A5B9MR78_9BACT|nr:AAA-like domain protein [Stieleria maiorica]
MLYDQFKRLIDRVPGLPQSLRQSFENPVQVERLPDTSGIQTEFPAYSESRAAAKKTIRRTLIVAVFICLLRSIPEHFLPIPWAYDLYGVLACLAAFTVTATLIGWPSKWWHYPLYFVALPALLLYILYLRSLFALLLLASAFTAIVADRFTKLTLYLGTTTPFPRDRARFVRSKWPSRLFSLNTIRGMEFYGLIVLVLVAAPFIVDGLDTAANPEGGSLHFAASLATLGVIVLLPVAVELLAAVFYGRRPLRVTLAWRAFKRSFVDWNCYNSREVAAPGILRSPVGHATSRRKMLLGVIYLWAAALIPLVSYRHAMHERLAYARTSASVKQRTDDEQARQAQEKRLREFIRPPDFASRQAEFKKQLALEREFDSWSGDLDAIPTLAHDLEPFQLKLLERLPQENRRQQVREMLGLIDAPLRVPMSTQPHDPAPEEQVAKSAAQDRPIFLLFSKIEHPYENDVTNFGKPQAREGFVFAQIFLILGLEQAIMLLLAFSFPIAFLYAASVRVAANLREQLEAHPDTILSFGNWNRLVDDVVKSGDETEQKSLLLGTNVSDGSPIMVPRSVFEEHAHILGDSGSGKTSLGISLILNQLIRQQDCSIVVIDLKGDDSALFSGTRMDAESAGKPFRWFTNELGKSSYAFNPFTQEYFDGLSLYQKTDVITAALGLQYGTDYGRGFYADANADYLYRTLQAHRHIRSFKQLAEILPTGIDVPYAAEVRKNASHLVSISQRLASTEALNVIDNDEYPKSVIDHQIDFADVFRRPQVIYLQLPSSLGTASSAEIARIALYSMIGSARQTPDAKRVQTFVFIDEFQRLVANNLELLMQTARSMKMGLILANQSIYDLKKPGIDLMPTVRTNTRYKQVFAASNIEDLRELVEVSGEALVHTRSYGQKVGMAGPFGGGILNLNQSESTTPRLRTNDVLLATDAEDQSIVQIRRGAGYAQYGGFPFIMRSKFHISADEYSHRKEQSWPEPSDETVVGTEVELSSPLDQFDPVKPLPDSPPDSPASSSGAKEITEDQFKSAKPTSTKRKKKQTKKPPRSSN